MHLRAGDALATVRTLRTLRRDLSAVVRKGDVCVFAGSMPGGALLGEVLAVVRACRDAGAKVVVDTSGEALRAIVGMGGIWLIKPNVEELGELVGEEVADRVGVLREVCAGLAGQVEMVLVSRGGRGAMVVREGEVWQGRCLGRRKVVNTVACGDTLLAGFLEGLAGGGDLGEALGRGVQAATGRAWGLMEGRTWGEVLGEVEVAVEGEAEGIGNRE